MSQARDRRRHVVRFANHLGRILWVGIVALAVTGTYAQQPGKDKDQDKKPAALQGKDKDKDQDKKAAALPGKDNAKDQDKKPPALPAVNPAGPVATVTVTVEVLLVTTLPNASSTSTVNAGLRACPAVPVAGVVW